MKKILALVMALCLLCGSAVAEVTLAGTLADIGFPITDSPVEVTIAAIPSDAAVDFDIEKNWMTRFINDYSGLKINWQIIDASSANERVSLMLNSGDMPDALIGKGMGTADIVQYGVTEGMFYPINDLLQYMPNFSAFMEENPSVKAAITATDGNIYGFPNCSDLDSFFDQRFFYNTKWLENLGMEMPTTLEGFKDYLIAVRDNDANGNGDPSDEIPWCGSWSESWSERIFILYAYNYLTRGDYTALSYNEEEPKIVYVAYEPKFKDYLLYMKSLWDEGLLDPDMFTQTEQQVQTTVLEGTVGFCGMSAPYVYAPNDTLDWKTMHSLVAEEGQKPIYPAAKAVTTISMMVINADASEEVAIALAKLADAMYTPEWYMLAAYGPEENTELDFYGLSHYVEDNVIKYHLTDDATGDWMFRVTYLSLWSLPGFNCNGNNAQKVVYGTKHPETQLGKYFNDGNLLASWVADCKWQDVHTPEYTPQIPDLYFTAEDQDRVNELTIPLQDYVASCEAKFIIGEMSIENDYDTFISTLEAYGVQELIDIYNKYYDAYKAN